VGLVNHDNIIGSAYVGEEDGFRMVAHFVREGERYGLVMIASMLDAELGSSSIWGGDDLLEIWESYDFHGHRDPLIKEAVGDAYRRIGEIHENIRNKENHGMTRVKVYLNESRTGLVFDGGADNRLRLALEFDWDNDRHGTPGDRGILDLVREQLNSIEPSADYALEYFEAGNRSLNVGDVVTTDNDANVYAVEVHGWRPLSPIYLHEGLAVTATH